MDDMESYLVMLFESRYQPTFAERYPIPLLAAVLDFLLVIAAVYLAYWLRFDSADLNAHYTTAAFTISSVVMLSLWGSGVYGSWRGISLARQIGNVLVGWVFAVGILLAVIFFLKVSDNYSRRWFVYVLFLGGGLSVLLRLIVYWLLRLLRSGGRNLKHVLVVDAGGASVERLNSSRSLREFGFRIAESLDFSRDSEWINALELRVAVLGVHEVWLCLPLSEGAAVKEVMYALRHHTVAIRFIPEWGDIPLLNHKVTNIAGLYALDLSCSPMDGPARVLKRMEDIILGGLISILILPVCLLIMVAIALTSKGPVLFKQYRTGINGKRFKVYKFRSMVVHQESNGQVTQASKNDERVTKVGAFLRRTSLDELPQFFNVLQGRMSIVGPRPHALMHNEYYKDLVESYMQRHKVKPGITGWAQVNGYRGQTDTLEKMQKRVEFDLWYIDNWSLGLDLKIILWTIFKGFINRNAY
ncbi:undecaprenyl-phosphate glucose phosphotransferase [Pseudomonas sp. P3C3]